MIPLFTPGSLANIDQSYYTAKSIANFFLHPSAFFSNVFLTSSIFLCMSRIYIERVLISISQYIRATGRHYRS